MGQFMHVDGRINSSFSQTFSLFFLYHLPLKIINQYNIWNICNFQMPRLPQTLALCLHLLHLLHLTQSHYIPKVVDSPVTITSYTNQAKSIDIPFKKCFQVSPQLAANKKYISFHPSSLQLTKLKEGNIQSIIQISLLQNLRSPQTFTHEHLTVLKNYSLSFMSPNIIIVIKQSLQPSTNLTQFSIASQYQIPYINQYTQFKIYKFLEKALLVINYYGFSYVNNRYEANEQPLKFLLLDQNGYEEVDGELGKSTVISHLEVNGEEQFFAAEYGRGLTCYSLSSLLTLSPSALSPSAHKTKKVKQIANYGKQAFKSQNLYIIDVNIKSLKTDNIIYVLDGIKGVYRMNFTESKVNPAIELILEESNCNSLDSLKANHLVLVCQLGVSSYIVEAYSMVNSVGKTVFVKLQPEYHLNYFNDLEINRNYYIAFSYKTLNVYWNTRENNIPETVNTQSQLDLPGLETFFIDIDPTGLSYLYTIQSGKMYQYLIDELGAKLTVKSHNPVQKSFKISMFGNCMDLDKSMLAKEEWGEVKGMTCQVVKRVDLTVVEENSPRKEDFSVSASIIVILIVVFLLIIWICLKKYKGLERQARRVLEAYKKKKARI